MQAPKMGIDAKVMSGSPRNPISPLCIVSQLLDNLRKCGEEIDTLISSFQLALAAFARPKRRSDRASITQPKAPLWAEDREGKAERLPWQLLSGVLPVMLGMKKQVLRSLPAVEEVASDSVAVPVAQ